MEHERGQNRVLRNDTSHLTGVNFLRDSFRYVVSSLSVPPLRCGYDQSSFIPRTRVVFPNLEIGLSILLSPPFRWLRKFIYEGGGNE